MFGHGLDVGIKYDFGLRTGIGFVGIVFVLLRRQQNLYNNEGKKYLGQSSNGVECLKALLALNTSSGFERTSGLELDSGLWTSSLCIYTVSKIFGTINKEVPGTSQ